MREVTEVPDEPLMWDPPQVSASWQVICSSCRTPVHVNSSMRKHKRTTLCRVRKEYLLMQERGLRKVDDYMWTLTPLVITRGKHGKYAPKAVVEYSRYISRDYLLSLSYSDHLPRETYQAQLDTFMHSTPEQQEAHLDGLRLAYELYLEQPYEPPF